MFFKNRDWVLVLLRLFPCSRWHRVCICRAVWSLGTSCWKWAAGGCIFGIEPSLWLSFLLHRRGQLSYHFFNCSNHQICISLGKINILLQNEPILIKSVSFHSSDVNCPFCWWSRCTRWINRVINHEWTCITLRITIRRNYLCICSLCRLLKNFFSCNDEFKRVNILTFNRQLNVVPWSSQTCLQEWFLHTWVLFLQSFDSIIYFVHHTYQMLVCKLISLKTFRWFVCNSKRR